MVARGRRKKAVVRPRAEEDADYLQWKSRIPLIYDWFTNHNLAWPSLSCRWGQQLEQKTYKNNQRLFFSERTDGTYPNTLVVANCEVVKPRVATAEHISMFDEESQSPYVKRIKTIVHPGEVNRIREFPHNSKIVATHTDSPEVFIWDVDAQPDCGDRLGDAECHPDLILKGHQSNAEYALAMCNSEPLVLSGGKDKLVVLWSINDHVSALLNSASTAYLGLLNGSLSYSHSKEATHLKMACTPTVAPRAMFHGHEDTVEDVQFCPFSPQEFCSVGDDSCLILWDARVGTNPALKVERAHDGDINCVDWNPFDVNLLLTGSADSSVKMFDRRYVTTGGTGSSVHTFQHHRAAVLCVQWCPDKSSVFGSAGEDNFLNIWDQAKVGASDEYSRPPGLFFQHAGHRDKVVDFHWCETEPWTIASVSDDCARVNGGGTLQLWRMSDFIYRPMEEVLAELETIKEQINCYSTET